MIKIVTPAWAERKWSALMDDPAALRAEMDWYANLHDRNYLERMRLQDVDRSTPWPHRRYTPGEAYRFGRDNAHPQ